MQSQDHYRVLGIERSASGAEIKTAFRRLAQRCHPDVCADPGARPGSSRLPRRIARSGAARHA